VAALLVTAWLAWAIYVASDRGVNKGLGVLIAWPAIVLALALISLPFIGGYLLDKRLSSESDDEAKEADEQDSGDEETTDEQDEEEETEDAEPEPETAAS
jgi:hypothetical protein